jgi:ribA/ribD-fused uncharacterized protein
MKQGMITSFTGKYAFLSNFHPCVIEVDGYRYPCVENAFQVCKTVDKDERLPFLTLSPGAAKRANRKVTLRADWEAIKLDVMWGLLTQKFSKPELKQMLLETGTQKLVEGNHWGDTFWGVCRGQGSNHLGAALMEVRAALL